MTQLILIGATTFSSLLSSVVERATRIIVCDMVRSVVQSSQEAKWNSLFVLQHRFSGTMQEIPPIAAVVHDIDFKFAFQSTKVYAIAIRHRWLYTPASISDAASTYRP